MAKKMVATPTLGRLRLLLRPTETLELMGLGGQALFGLTLKLFRLHHPALAARIHDDRGLKPLSIFVEQESILKREGWAVVEAGQELTWNIGTLSAETTGVTSDLWATLSAQDYRTDFKGTKCEINVAKNGWVTSSHGAIAREARSIEELGFRFLSPTSFRLSGKQHLFPEPEFVFGSLIRKWNSFSEIRCPTFDADQLSRIKVLRYELRTEMVEFDNYRVVGFMGDVSYGVTPELTDECSEVMAALATFAEYCGVGYKTTMGLGHVETAGGPK
jgi:CRISPR-associated endoribonuclease Cas6